MVNASKAHDYDRAIEIGNRWLSAHPQDDAINGQLGYAYYVKAQHDPLHQREFLSRSAQAFQDSIAASLGEPLPLLNAAWGFKIIGNVSAEGERCAYYERASEALRRVQATITADKYTLRNGEQVDSAPIRRGTAEMSDRLEKDIASDRCK